MHLYVQSTKILKFAKMRVLRAVHDSRTRSCAAFLLCLLCAGTGRRLIAQSPTTTQLTITANGLPLTAVPLGTVVTVSAAVQGRAGLSVRGW